MSVNWVGNLDISRKPEDDSREWVVNSPLTFRCLKMGIIVTVKKGFISDGASVPKVFWWYASPWSGKHAPAALIHDGIYRSRLKDKSFADWLFYEAMLDLGVRKPKAWLMFQSVKIGGGKKWLKENGGKQSAVMHPTVTVTTTRGFPSNREQIPDVSNKTHDPFEDYDGHNDPAV